MTGLNCNESARSKDPEARRATTAPDRHAAHHRHRRADQRRADRRRCSSRAASKVMVPLDFQAIVSRRLCTQDAWSGRNWNGFMTAWLSVDMMNPLTNSMVNAACDKGQFGWPATPRSSACADAYARAPDLPARQKIAVELQARAVQYGTHIHLGQYTLPTATRAGPPERASSPANPVFWNIEKGN